MIEISECVNLHLIHFSNTSPSFVNSGGLSKLLSQLSPFAGQFAHCTIETRTFVQFERYITHTFAKDSVKHKASNEHCKCIL